MNEPKTIPLDDLKPGDMFMVFTSPDDAVAAQEEHFVFIEVRGVEALFRAVLPFFQGHEPRRRAVPDDSVFQEKPDKTFRRDRLYARPMTDEEKIALLPNLVNAFHGTFDRVPETA